MAYVTQKKKGEELNRPYEEDLPVHEWYRFILSYPPHLVRDYVEKLSLSKGDRVLDPFCGTGTTLVECKKMGLPSVGLEANPVVAFAASVKTRWDIDPQGLRDYGESVAEATREAFREQGLEDEPFWELTPGKPAEYRTVSEEKQRLLIKNSISALPLHKVLVLMEKMGDYRDSPYDQYGRLALAKALVCSIGNLKFGPEVGVGKVKEDAAVVGPWEEIIRAMVKDLGKVKALDNAPAVVEQADARSMGEQVEKRSIDGVITSPPYPNEKDYSRTTRLESVLLGFMSNREELRKHKEQFIRSNTRGVYVADTDDEWIADFPRIQNLADRIEEKRVELGKTSGFEKHYHRVVRLYFGGMVRHLENLKALLRPGARLAYVVGEQASYFQIMIETGEILASIAERLGYKVEDIELFRSRFSTTTRSDLKEQVVVLKWNP